MRTSQPITILSLAILGLLAAGCAGDGPSVSTGPSAGVGGPAVAPASLDACMARIPSDATPGQRMIAEETCRRDVASRNAVVQKGTPAATSAAAAGAASDTLEGCIARIPKDATAGQRMLAEESCKQTFGR